MFLGLVLVASGLAATLFATGSARAATPFRSLRIGEVGLQITTFNPLLITLTDEYVAVYNTYSTLVTFDKSYQPIPDLAYNWSLAADDVTWTFHLVHNAYFVDPTNPSSTSHPVTSADVVFSYNLNMNTPGSIFYTYVTALLSVSAPDPYTVQIVTRYPFAAMYSTLTNIPILPQYLWSVILNPLKYSPPYPIGSGPMYYDSANSTASLVVYRRSSLYYGTAYYCRQVRPNEVRYIGYASSATLVNDFLTGANNLDAIEGIDPASYTSALGTWSPKWGVNEGFTGEISNNAMTDAERAALINAGYTQFRNADNNQILATNLTVREAIAMSINKTVLVQDALLGLGIVADSLVPDSNPWHYAIPLNDQFRFNTTAARALLNAAGWKYDSLGNLNPNATPLYQVGATNPLIFRFYTLNAASEWQIAATDIVNWLHQTGIETTDRFGNLNPGYGLYSVNQMSAYWLSGDYDMWLWDWVFAPGSDVSLDILSVETTMAIGPTSDNYYSNATYDALYNQSLTTIDPVARRNITDTMQLMIYQYASYILPYYKLNLFAATTTRWTNWGDWSTDVGLAPDSDLPDLWFQVEPVDNRAPAISDFPAVLGQNSTATDISVVASDTDGDPLNFTWTFGDGTSPVTTTTGTVQHTYALPGNYTLGVVVSDGEWLACGNSTAEIVPYSPAQNFPPTLTPIQAFLPFSFPNGTAFGAVNVPALFGLYVQDPEGDPVNLTWYWGDGTSDVQQVNDTATLQPVLAGHVYAAPGNYTVTMIGSDNRTGAGNHTITESVSGVLILLDTTPPVTTASVSGTQGQNGWYTSAVEVTLTATDDLTGVAATAYSIDGGTPVAYTAPFSVSTDGNHTITYASIDGALNVETPKTLSLKIDATGPSTMVQLNGQGGNAGWYVSPVTVTLIAADAASGIAATNYSVDNGPWQAYAAPFTLSTDGNHTVRYYSVDNAGVQQATGSFNVHIDSTPPSATAAVAGTPGNGGWYTSSATVTLVASDAMSGIASISYSLDGGAWTNYSGSLALSDGNHTVEYRAADVAGNTGPVRSLTVSVDTVAPALTALTPSGYVTTSTVQFFWTGDDSGSGIVDYAISVDGGAFQDNGGRANAVLTLSDGTHTITVRATDAAGNVATRTTTVTVDTNLFSFTGPYRGLPTIALIVLVAAALVAIVWIRRRRKATPAPQQTPPPPAP